MSKARIVAAAALAMALALGGWFAYKRPSSRGENWAGRTIKVSRGPIQAAIEATGSITPLNRIEVKPPIPGRIDRLLVNEGEKVKEGQVLAWMSSSDRAAILDAARAVGPDEIKRWQDAYKPTPIIAPLTGVVILRNVVQGQTVEGGTVLYAISDSLIVTAQVDESDIGQVRAGMPAEIVLDAFPRQPVQGEVFDVLYEGKNVSNVITYGVKIKPLRAPAFFRSQMTATVSFITGKKDEALLIPAAAIRVSSSGAKKVLVPGDDGKPAPRDIETGIENGDQVEVLSGLKEGDAVLTASGRYTPQQGPAASPLTMKGPQNRNAGRAPRQRRSQ